MISPFILGEQVDLEESMTCEFKEVKSQPPVQAIGRIIDEYVVAFLNAKGGSLYWGIRDDRRVVGVQLNDKMRDEMLQVAGQKIAAIAPPVAADLYDLPFHQVIRPEDRCAVEETFVVEVSVRATGAQTLYLTGSGEAYRKTLGGTQKLSGAQLLTALCTQLNEKFKTVTDNGQSPDLARMPSVARRAGVVGPLLRDSHVLWVDDTTTNNLYERTILRSFGISIDLALSTDEALYMANHTKYDLILSDMNRADNPAAGIELMDALLRRSANTPVVYYVGKLDRTQGTPVGAFGITNRPDELLHYVFDVLERREDIA